jgi:hypothetical protein
MTASIRSNRSLQVSTRKAVNVAICTAAVRQLDAAKPAPDNFPMFASLLSGAGPPRR